MWAKESGLRTRLQPCPQELPVRLRYVLGRPPIHCYIFMGRGFTSGGQLEKSVSGFSAAACKIQASKRYIESLPLVPKIKEAVSLKVKGPLYSCLLITYNK